MVKPLKDLIAEADKFLGQTKTAAPVLSDEVSSLADTLAFATDIEEQFIQSENSGYSSEFEKTAKAINKIAAQVELEILTKTEQFEKAAKVKGYDEKQIGEALSKIAAAKVQKRLSELAEINVDSVFGGAG